MPQDSNNLSEQLDCLINMRAVCLDSHANFLALQAELQSLTDASEQSRLDAERTYAERLTAQQNQITSVHRTEMDELSEQFEADQAGIARELDMRLSDLQDDHEELVSDRRKKLESELWILQSVCDGSSDDSPIGHMARTRDTFATQQTMLEERFAALANHSANTARFMAGCHAAPDEEVPPPDIKPLPRDESRAQAIEQIELAITNIADIGRLKLPHWIYGLRPALLWLVLFVVVTIGTISLRADLRSYINADVIRPDWRWAGISSVIGLVSSSFVTMILMLIAQQKLRNRFAAVMQHTSNARAADRHWAQRMQAEVRRQQKAAEEWQITMTRDRETRVARMTEATEQQISELRSEYADAVGNLQTTIRKQLSERQADYRASVEHSEQSYRCETESAEQSLQAQMQSSIEAQDLELHDRNESCHQQLDAIRDRWRSGQLNLSQLSQASRDIAAGLTRWPAATPNSWKSPLAIPPVISVGDFLSTVPTLAKNSDDAVVNTCIDMPALLSFPADAALLIEHDSSGRDAALEFVRGVLLRLLTTVPPGRIQFTLIDPVGLGQSFSAMMHLADFDELLISNRIWTEASQIREQLQKVTEHMENVFQTYLRSEFETIEQYNQAAGEVAEPYHIVVIAGFPVGFSEESARHLTSILSSGRRCGVYPVVVKTSGQPLPRSFDEQDFYQHCQIFQVVGDRPFPVRDASVIDQSTGIEFEALQSPAAPDYVNIVRQVGEASRDARRVEVSFTRIAPRADAIWSHSTADSIDLPIGRAGAARLQFLRLGRGTSQHVLIAGKTGSGKSTLLHILITNLAMHYSPNEIQFYLIDFKKGVEFRTYAANHLPHARVIAIESDREFGLSVLKRLDEVLQERGELFRLRGVQDLPAFRRDFPNETMPRLLLLIDEFQEFFVAEDRVSSRAALLLDRLIRQGRAFGIHVVLGSQTLGGAYSLARSTLGQVAVRIALQCSESDAHLILSEDNSAARLLSRPGEAIYNDANGLLEGNHPFQIAWLEEEQREPMIEELRSRRIDPPLAESRMVVFEGNVAPSIELCTQLHSWLTCLPDGTDAADETATIWLGEPVAIAEPTRVELRRAGGQNLLIVGLESEMADSLLLMSVISGSRTRRSTDQNTDDATIHFLHDGRDRDSLARMRAAIPDRPGSVCQIHLADDVDQVVADLHGRMQQRETVADPANSAPEMLIIRNIGQFRDLRRDEDEFSLGSYGEAKTETAATQLGDLIKRGPLVGIHVIIWSDSYSNASRWLSTSLMREFENRVAFRMNPTDSASLIDSPAAAAMTPGRAILYRDQTGATEKFRPFAWPSEVWLDELQASLAVKDPTGDPDIDSLTIE
jgi:DNA segregation ATPase FtsK/SpoIIIE, S-DNA-T family